MPKYLVCFTWLFAFGLWPLATAGPPERSPLPRPVGLGRMVERLESEKFGVREEASRQLASLDVEAVPPELLAAARSSDPEVRERANKAITAIKDRIFARVMGPSVELGRKGLVDLYVASSVSWELPADNPRLWEPAFELGRDISKQAKKPWPLGTDKARTFSEYVGKYDPLCLRQSDPFPKIDNKGNPLQNESRKAMALIAPNAESRMGFTRSLIITTENVRSGHGISACGVFANGIVNIKGDAHRCIIIADGDVDIDDQVWSSVIISRGTIKVKVAFKSVLIAGGTISMKLKIPDGTDAENVTHEYDNSPLDFVKFFEFETIGCEVRFVDGFGRVSAVANRRPAAKGDIQVGDIVEEVNGKKPGSLESLRRLLRDALAVGDATVTVRRGDKTETVKVSLPE